jgi:hypothetical protein
MEGRQNGQSISELCLVQAPTQRLPATHKQLTLTRQRSSHRTALAHAVKEVGENSQSDKKTLIMYPIGTIIRGSIIVVTNPQYRTKTRTHNHQTNPYPTNPIAPP